MNQSRIRFILFLIVANLFGSCVYAQVNDAGLWASVNLEKKFTKKISLHFTEELRFNENITELGVFFSELTGEYQFNKNFSVSAGYRFINKRNLDDSYSKRHRIITEVNYKNKFGHLGASVRLRYQSQYADYQSTSDGQVPSNYLRTRLKFKYDLDKKYGPFISGETFYYLNRADGVLFDNYRIAGGVEYDFNKRSSLETGFIFNREVNVSDPWTSYIFAISWNYIFK